MTDNSPLRKDLTSDEFIMFRDWIHQHSGIYLEEIKMDSLRISLVTRATRHDFTDYNDYFELLSHDEEEFKELMNLVTINETSFFRFPAQFDALRDKVIPEIVQKKPASDRGFRVWSAGCSTGEEPYTIGMTLLESVLEPMGFNMEVTGSDVSTQALERARKAVYPARSLANLSQNTIQRWFEPVPDGHRPIPKVRRLCGFHYQNLIKQPFPLAYQSNWDVIFCRNVTIYFRVESTRRVVDNFYESLNPGGYLFIGHSETLSSISDRFEPVEINGVFLYRKADHRRTFAFADILARREERKRGKRLTSMGAQQPAAAPRRERAPRTATPASVNTPKQAHAEKDEAVTASALVAGALANLEAARAGEALDLALKAIDLEPRNMDAHVVAAFAYADTGDLAAATAQAQSALNLNPLAAAARYILGIIKRDQGDLPGAVAEFKRTIYIDGDFVLAHFALAGIRRQQMDFVQARRDYENTLRALDSNPDGDWTAFLGGFKADLLVQTCQVSLVECGKGGTRG